MNKTIHVKIMSEDALIYLRKNVESISTKVSENETNEWIYDEFPKPMFVEKSLEIYDFELERSPESSNKEADYRNAIKIYEHLNKLPRYIICDERFWLWLHFEKFYSIVRDMMKIRGSSTIKNAWMHEQGTRRGLMFGVLSRLYFRVEFSVDESKTEDKYELTRWVIDNPLRFRNLTWRSFSSEKHLVRGALRGEKMAIDENGGKENNDFYPVIGKYISVIGSVRLLDEISEKDMEEMIYKKMIDLFKNEDALQ